MVCRQFFAARGLRALSFSPHTRANLARGDELNLSRDIHGRVEIAPATGEILRATTDLKVDVDLQSSVGIIRVTGTMHGEVKPPPTATQPERKPDKPPVVEPGDKRLEWAYKDQHKDKNTGSFKRNDDGTWVETNTRNEHNTYEEWQRNPDYVVLVDPKRKIYLRAYADHMDIFNNQQKWATIYKGEWAASSR